MVHITALPSELLALIVSYLDPSSLKKLRQTCHLLSFFATQLLFNTVELYPTEDSYEIMDGISKSSTLKYAVKKVYINTYNPSYGLEDKEEAYFPREFENRILQLKHLSKVQTAIVQFDLRSGIFRRHWILMRPQTAAFRKKALSVLFEWLASLEVPLQSLGIQHLQYINKDDETSNRITKVLRNLRSLRLSIVREHKPATTLDAAEFWSQNQSSLFPKSQSIFTELPSVWLKPTASSLEHLTLYCGSWFGFCPKLELSELHFPHLKSLALGSFSFFQDSQLEWILSHGATLNELSLDDCMILYDLSLQEDKLGEFSFDEGEMELRREGDGELGYYRSYDKRWHHYFDAFRTRLPRLRCFRIGASDWRRGVPLESETEIRIGLLVDRYRVFYDGHARNPYLKVNFGPEPWQRGAPKCNEDDRESLRLLFKHIGQEVEESWLWSLREIWVENLIEVRS